MFTDSNFNSFLFPPLSIKYELSFMFNRFQPEIFKPRICHPVSFAPLDFYFVGVPGHYDHPDVIYESEETGLLRF